MSIVVLRLLYCDGGKKCDWDGPFSTEVTQQDSSREQRTSAHSVGWVTIGNKDYCPNCAKRLGKKEATSCPYPIPGDDGTVKDCVRKEEENAT